MIGAFFIKRTGSLAYVEDVDAGSGIAYAAEVQGGGAIWHGLELDYIRVRKELTIGNTSTGPYIKTGTAANDINTVGTQRVNAANILLTTGSVLSDWQATGDVTKINGGKIYTGSVITSALAFVPLISSGGTGAIVATINASAEGIRISGAKITIDGTVSFSSGYDPTGKVAAGGAAADVNANTTTISGGKITTNSITADRLNVTSLSAISANLGTVTAGTVTGAIVQNATDANTRIRLDTSGLQMGGVNVTTSYSGSPNYLFTTIFDIGSTTSANNKRLQFVGGVGDTVLMQFDIQQNDYVFAPRFPQGIYTGSNTITEGEIAALTGITGATIQTQLNAKAVLASANTFTAANNFNHTVTMGAESSIGSGDQNVNVTGKNTLICSQADSVDYTLTLTNATDKQILFVVNTSTLSGSTYTVNPGGISIPIGSMKVLRYNSSNTKWYSQ